MNLKFTKSFTEKNKTCNIYIKCYTKPETVLKDKSKEIYNRLRLLLISLYFRIDRQTNFEINMIFFLKVMLNHFIVAFEPMKSLISEMTPKSIRGKFPKIILVINNLKKYEGLRI